MKEIVLHIVGSLDFGGVESHMRIIAESASGSHYEHRFCAICRGGAVAQHLHSAGTQVYVLGVPARIPSFAAVAALVRLFRSIRPTVVHTHGAESNFHGLLAARIAGVPNRVGEEIGIPSHSLIARLVFRQTYRCAHAVIGVSQAVTQWLIYQGEVRSERTRTLVTGIQAQGLSTPVEQKPAQLSIAYVARLHPIKNPIGLIQAVALLRNQGLPCEVYLVGDGPQRGEVEMLVRREHLEHSVHLLGYCPEPMVQVAKCHLLVQPSISEGLGLSVLEAMAAGLPVIATSKGGAGEIVEHGRTGWLVDTSRPENIAHAIQEAWALGPTRLHQIGMAARAIVMDRLSATRYIECLETLYDELKSKNAA